MNKVKDVEFESNPFKVIFNGFDKLFKYNQTMAIILLVFSVLGFFGQFFNYGFDGGSSQSTASGSGVESTAIVTVILVLLFIFFVAALFIGTFVNGLTAYVVYMTAKKETTTFGEAAKVVIGKFWTIFYVQILVFLRILGGTLLFIVPGIRASLRYNMVLLPIFEENASAKQAIAKSKAITKNHLIEIFGMVVAAGIIPLVGQLMQTGGQVVMYPQLNELHVSGERGPKVHWLNYLAFYLLLGFVVFISLIVGLVLLVASS